MPRPFLASMALVVLCAAGLAGVARAEVSARPHNNGRVDTLIMGDVGITDGIDPIPQVWQPYRDLPSEWVLNPTGADRGDGRPDVVFHRVTGYPIVVWSYNRGDNYDIALAKWLGAAWSPVEFVTNTPQDELDPRVFVKADGTLYIAWWVDAEMARVELTARGPVEPTWAAPIWISDVNEPGIRPTVAWFANAVWVAYERDATQSPLNTREVALRRQNDLGTFVLEHVVNTSYDDLIDPLLHVKPGKFWIDWRFSENQFAYYEINDPTANGANLENWGDPTWIGVESIRLLIAQLVGLTSLPYEEEPVDDGPTTP